MRIIKKMGHAVLRFCGSVDDCDDEPSFQTRVAVEPEDDVPCSADTGRYVEHFIRPPKGWR